ncbi:MAG: TonB-dependent receptor, partial [Pseudomonadales bacterium]
MSRFNPNLKLLATGITSAAVGILPLSAAVHAAQLEETVVTAQKREQNLQDVPVAISVITSQAIDDLGINTISDLADHTPGLQINSTSTAKPSIFIRGVGNEDFNQGSVGAVGVYRDGVYQGAAFSYGAVIMDLNRVEVLKGPQGTLWGRNTTGGLVSYVSEKHSPGDETTGYVYGTAAEFGTYGIEAAFGVSITDNLAVRVAATYDETDGYIESEALDIYSFGSSFANFPDGSPDSIDSDDIRGHENMALRAIFTYDPTEKLSIDTALSYTDDEGTPLGVEAKGLDTDPFFVNGGAPFTPGCTKAGMIGSNCADAFGYVQKGAYDSAEEFDPFQDIETKAASVTITYDLTDDVSLTSISAYQDGEYQSFEDTDGSPNQILVSGFDNTSESFSQELRLNSDYDGSFNWIAGVFYYEDELETTFLTALPIFAPDPGQAKRSTIETETYSIFGEGIFYLTDTLELTVGARWTEDERSVDAITILYDAKATEFMSWDDALMNAVEIQDAIKGLEKSEGEPSGRVALSYQLNDEVTLWSSIARGFKGGDYNTGAVGGADFRIVDPEFLTSYEIGAKAKLFDDSLSLNVSYYYYDYADKQVFVELFDLNFGNRQDLSNAGEVTIQGFEASLYWVPTENLYIQANYAYTDSVFDDFVTVDAFGEVLDLSGNTTANTPENTFSIIANQSWNLGDSGNLSVQ